MLCDVAWARAHGTNTFIMPDVRPQAAVAQKLVEAMPGLPANVVKLIDDLPAGVCGRCTAFVDGQCTERHFSVAPKDPACVVFIPRE